jgi:HTH-type transcriptional regulator, transcriptional repressor of NAD biosynthesis genes
VIKICLFGPESVGKTTMAQQLLGKYQAIQVPELARNMVSNSNFTEADIVAIGNAQTEALLLAQKADKELLIADTDLITTQLYSQIYLNAVPPILLTLEQQVTFDHYFLFAADVPWVPDGLRDLGHRRSQIFAMFEQALTSRHIQYTLVHGSWHYRQQVIMQTLAEKFHICPTKNDKNVQELG